MAGPQEQLSVSLPRRVLIVDDNVDCREALAAFLILLGNEVRTAAGGDEALQIAAQFCPTVILLDICMPDMDGHELCGRLRQMDALTGAAIYAFTALNKRELGTHSAFDGHYVKPVDFERLASALGQGASSPDSPPK